VGRERSKGNLLNAKYETQEKNYTTYEYYYWKLGCIQ
jgi:hypothetical protein